MNNLSSFVHSPLGDKLLTWSGGKMLQAILYVRSSKKELLEEAKLEYEKVSSLGNLEDFKQALNKHWVSYSEYAHQYEFYKKTEEERDELLRLRNENEYLKAENEVIKKSIALRHAEWDEQLKAKKQKSSKNSKKKDTD